MGWDNRRSRHARMPGVSDTANLRRTVLWSQHHHAAARMVAFGGWDMPVQYPSGIMKEHLAVRDRVGMFDVSHMGEFVITGPDALAYLQWVTVNDLAKLKPGRAHYNMLPNANGGLVDDVYIYCLAPNHYLMVVNAANIDKDWAHLRSQTWKFDVILDNHSDAYGLIAVQGPQAATTLAAHSPDDLITPKKNSVFTTSTAGSHRLYRRRWL
jgi:aminomethyltransferase